MTQASLEIGKEGRADDGVDLTPEALDDLIGRALRQWETGPDGSRHPAAGEFAHVVLSAWAQEVRAAHDDGDTARLEAALEAMVRDAGQMVATAAADAHLHHYAHAGKGAIRRRGQRLVDEDIAEQFRKSLAGCGKATAAALETAEVFGVSERTVWRALQRLGVAAAG